MTFGQKIYNLRTSRGLSQIEFARLIGSSQSAITSWEGNVRTPKLDTIKKVADVFQIPVEELISSDNPDDDAIRTAKAIQAREKLGLLFDKTQKMSDRDLDAMLAVASAIIREGYGD